MGTGGAGGGVGATSSASAATSGLDTVTVVLPCLDEEESVGRCVEEARAALVAAGVPHEVIVVDNGSLDVSVAVAEAAGAEVVHEARRGYGQALRAGFAAASGDVIVMADADFTYDLSKLPTLVEPVRRGEADVVVGGRLDGVTRRTMPLLHRFVGTPVLTFLVARACGRRVVGDSQSGFRAFRRDRLDDLALSSTGMELASEMLIRAVRAGLRVQEVPTGYRPRIGESKLDSFADGWRHLQLVLLLAPDVLLVGPGALLLAVGVGFSVLAFLQPAGISVGSLRWQPVFFSGTAIVLGAQLLLAGAVVAHRSSLAAGGARRWFSFVGSPAFLGRCLAFGLAGIALGLAIDAVLLVGWLRDGSSPPRYGQALTSVAQSLLILGGTLTSFGVVGRYLAPLQPREASRDRVAGGPRPS